MDDILFGELKAEYKDILKKRKEYEEKKRRLEFLKNNRLVKEYISLCEELGDYRVDSFMKREDDTQLRYLFGEFCRKSKTTNGIYIYLGTYKYVYDSDIIHGDTDEQVNYNDERASYSLYRNIESDSSIMIGLVHREAFENSHVIIYPNRDYLSCRMVNFDKLQTEFARDCINCGQDEAVKRVLAKSRKNN